MRVRILKEAYVDIRDGWRFYDDQEQGLGRYFSSTILETFVRSAITQAFILSGMAITGCLSVVFPIPSTMTKMELKCPLSLSLTTVAIPLGLRDGWRHDLDAA